eukprot:Nk52_evm19s252 gene=Nk52_evmTU19s252
MGKLLDHKLSELGAKRFYSTGYADDGTGMDKVVEPWIENLWGSLTKFLVDYVAPESADEADTENDQAAEVTEVYMPKGLPRELPAYLSCDVKEKICPEKCNLANMYGECKYATAGGDGYAKPCPITSIKWMTNRGMSLVEREDGVEVKRVAEVSVDVSELNVKYKVGDVFGFVPKNDALEVDLILKRLELNGDTPFSLSLLQGTKKRGAAIPAMLPKEMTYRGYFLNFADIRSQLKKTMLRLFADFATDLKEKNELLLVSSREGSEEYEIKIRENLPSLLDLLLTYRSVNIPFVRLVENLPTITPRYYSATSTPLAGKEIVSFVFSVSEYESCMPVNGIESLNVFLESGKEKSFATSKRRGLCTGFFEDVFDHCIGPQKMNQKENSLSQDNNEGANTLESELKGLKLSTSNPRKTFAGKEVLVFHKKTNDFNLPHSNETPLLLIGPGTGVAPFIGFLRERQIAKLNGCKSGSITLIYGCRYDEFDFLYKDELNEYLESGVLTKLYVAFSRKGTNVGGIEGKYVQCIISKLGEDILRLMNEEQGSIYLCGDAKGMAVSVELALAHLICDADPSKTIAQGKEEVLNWSIQNRFKKDIW